MQAADKAPEEELRLCALRELRILDTMPETAYDDITEIAAQACSAPVALISLVDENRQWFKSRVGITIAETPRDVAFCAHTILQTDNILIIKDAKNDPRFADNPLVISDPGIRFYAGVSLLINDHHALGTLCVIDYKPRDLDESQTAALIALGRQVTVQLQLRRQVLLLDDWTKHLETSRRDLMQLCGELENNAETIERDLERAELIQRSLRPQVAPEVPNFHIHSLYRPGRQIGGDFFEINAVGTRYIVVVIADASGHGISAAILSLLFQQRLEMVDQITDEPLKPAAAMRAMNRAIVREVNASGVFVTVTYCLIDLSTRVLTMGSAGHPPAICLHARSNRIEVIERSGPAIGLYEEAEYTESTLQLDSGDSILLLTDGLVEVPGVSPAELTELAAALKSTRGETNPLRKIFEHFNPEARDRDDVTMILLNFFSGENSLLELPANTRVSDSTANESGSLSCSESEHTTFICLHGKLNWVFGDTLLGATVDTFDKHRDVILDLGFCDYLDSTMLGTLHEVVVRAESAGQKLGVQRVSPALLSAFDELSLTSVISCIATDVLPVPRETREIALPKSTLRHQRRRLVMAHEALSALSESNRKEFAGVLKALNSDSEGNPSAHPAMVA